MNIPRIICFLVISLLITFSISAQTSDFLTPQKVESFVESFRDLREIGKKYDAQEIMNPDISGGDSMARAANPFSAAITHMQGHRAYNEMLAAINRHGYSDLQQWGTTGDRIMRAFAANSMETELPQVDEQMKQALEQIENSNLTDTQKKAMLQMMQLSTQAMDSYTDVSETDKAAVLPFMSAIEVLSQQ